MTDREKVIKEFEHLLNAAKGNYQDFVDLTVDGGEEILTLLKEQAAVEPVTESSVYDPDTWFFVCGSCKKSVIDRGDKFCRLCGKAVKWDDSD